MSDWLETSNIGLGSVSVESVSAKEMTVWEKVHVLLFYYHSRSLRRIFSKIKNILILENQPFIRFHISK